MRIIFPHSPELGDERTGGNMLGRKMSPVFLVSWEEERGKGKEGKEGGRR